MKRLLVIAAVALGAVACVEDNGDNSVRFLGVGRLEGSEGGCKPGDTQLGQGMLDVSAGVNYVLGLRLTSDLKTSEDNVNGEPFSAPGLNDFIIQELALSYTSQPALSLTAESLITSFRIPAGSGEESYLLLGAFGPQSLGQLPTLVAPGQTAMVFVTIKGVGELGSGKDMETNEFTFPIQLFNSGFQGCVAPATRALNGPCGMPGGQDGTQPSCSSSTTP